MLLGHLLPQIVWIMCITVLFYDGLGSGKHVEYKQAAVIVRHTHFFARACLFSRIEPFSMQKSVAFLF